MEIIGYVDRFSPFEKRDLKIYALITSLLKEIEKGKIPKLFYLTKLIEFLGFKPETTKCSICKRPIEGGEFFIDVENGISICKNCLKEEKRGIIMVDRDIGLFLQNPKREEKFDKNQKEKLYMLISLYLKSIDTKK